MINLLQSLKRSLAYAVLWMLFTILDCVLSVNERHKHCAPTFSCGHKIDLYYPFWTSDREECGHPDFKVNCSDGFAELTISSVKLRILEMNSKSRIIRLARMDYINDLCPHKPENATLNNQVLPFSEDTELRTFYYRCRLSPKVNFTNSGHIRQLDCGDDTGRQSFSVSSHLYSRKREIINELRASCGSIVNVPVSRSALRIEERNQSAEAITKALEKGFELSFNRDCSRCRRSKGACGYNNTLGGFVCYCINEPHKHTCEKNGNGFFSSYL